MPPKGLRERLNDGETILIAEGYLFEAERRGYLQAGAFVPEVVIDHPEVVKQLHTEFVRAGSDVVQAFTFYCNPEKMALVGLDKDNSVEDVNRKALRIARQVADETGTLMCGDITITASYDPQKKETHEIVRQIFKDQVKWAVEEGADYIVGETFGTLGEAKLCLEAIKQYGNGLPSVITLAAAYPAKEQPKTLDGVLMSEACAQLEKLGADVVGLNCFHGPESMTKNIAAVRAACKGPVAALPVTYRTTDDHPVFLGLLDPDTGERSFFADLDCHYSSQTSVTKFGKAMAEAGVRYVGLCCGNSPRHMRALAESYGRTPEASRYSTNMNKHITFGKAEEVKTDYFMKIQRPKVEAVP